LAYRGGVEDLAASNDEGCRFSNRNAEIVHTVRDESRKSVDGEFDGSDSQLDWK
jgi:hypothetical protein